MVLVSRKSKHLWVPEDPRKKTVRAERGINPKSLIFFLVLKHMRLLVADGLMLLSSFYRENILVLDIFFEALNYETIEQKKAYEVAALLGKERSGEQPGVCVILCWSPCVLMGQTDAMSGCTGYVHCLETPSKVQPPSWPAHFQPHLLFSFQHQSIPGMSQVREPVRVPLVVKGSCELLHLCLLPGPYYLKIPRPSR